MRSSANFTAIFQLSNARIICFRYFYTGTLATSLTFLRLLHKNVAKRTVAFVELFILGGRIGRWWLVRFSFPPEVACFHTLPGHWHMNDPLLSILSWIRVNDMLRFTRRFFFSLLDSYEFGKIRSGFYTEITVTNISPDRLMQIEAFELFFQYMYSSFEQFYCLLRTLI